MADLISSSLEWSALVYAGALALAAILSTLLALYGWRSWRRDGRQGGREFALLMAGAAVWALFYSLEIVSPNLGLKVAFATAEYLGILALPPAWFLFARRYTGSVTRLPTAVRVILVLVPVVTFCLLVTNAWHGLMWSQVELPGPEAFPGLVITHGPWFWVNMAYSYALLMLGSVLLVYGVYRYPQVYRRQLVILVVASLAPWVGNALLIFGILPTGSIDPTPFVFLVTGLLFAWSMSRFRFLSLLPALFPTVRHQLFQTMRDAVLVLDTDGKVAGGNPAASLMLGMPLSSLSGKVLADLLGPAAASLARQQEDGTKDLQFEVSLGTVSEERTYDVVSSALRLPGGADMGHLLAFRDITERQRTEEQLRKSEAKYRVLYEGMMDGFVQVNMDGEIIECNQAYQDMLGYERCELHQMRYMDLTPNRWRAYEEDIVRKQVLPRGYSEIYEKEYRRKDGTLFPVELRTALITDQAGVPAGMWAIVRDISERKKTERSLEEAEGQLRQAQKMEAVGQLAGGIAHDFNNLLTAIIGYAELALDADDEDCRCRSDVLEIKKAAERAADLTRQILAFSRRQTLQPKVVCLNDVVSDVSSLLRRTLGEDVDLVFCPHPDLGSAEVDASQIQQVLINLVVNARSAMPSGGRLTIETANVTLDDGYCRTHPSTTPGPHVMLSVSDTGCGMDTETMSRVFEPFYTTRAVGEGTGLGLATAYGIVKQSGGSILVYSELEKGTTFKIYLPRLDACRLPPSPTPASREVPRGHETILVVEDEPTVRSLVSRILSHQGYSLLKAAEGTEAGRILADTAVPIDLLLTDVLLPGGIQGHVLAGMARAARPDLPVLFMSGYTHNALMHDGRLDEGTNFLEKPFTADALVLKVRQVLDGVSA